MKNFNAGMLRFTSLVLAGGLVAVGCSHKKAAVVGPTSAASPSAAAAPSTCPLTGVVPAGGSVPNRPALVAKIPNDSTARGHQSGVDTADIVYEEPVEGGITRWAAVFQCQDADKVEPIRSGRGVDLSIVAQLSKPIFVHAGGFANIGSDHELSDLQAANVLDADLLSTAFSADSHRDSALASPNNLYFGTQAIYARAGSAAGGAPKPVFTFSSALTASPSAAPSGSPAVTATGTVTGTVAGATVKVPFSAAPYNVTWTWDATNGVYLRNYDSGKTEAAAKLANGTQISARNVIIQEVAVSATGPVEDSQGSKENLVTMDGTGKALVCRMGTCVQGTWSRQSGSAATQFLDASNVPIPMAPGTSWVELLPNTQVPAVS